MRKFSDYLAIMILSPFAIGLSGSIMVKIQSTAQEIELFKPLIVSSLVSLEPLKKPIFAVAERCINTLRRFTSQMSFDCLNPSTRTTGVGHLGDIEREIRAAAAAAVCGKTHFGKANLIPVIT